MADFDFSDLPVKGKFDFSDLPVKSPLPDRSILSSIPSDLFKRFPEIEIEPKASPSEFARAFREEIPGQLAERGHPYAAGTIGTLAEFLPITPGEMVIVGGTSGLVKPTAKFLKPFALETLQSIKEAFPKFADIVGKVAERARLPIQDIFKKTTIPEVAPSEKAIERFGLKEEIPAIEGTTVPKEVIEELGLKERAPAIEKITVPRLKVEVQKQISDEFKELFKQNPEKYRKLEDAQRRFQQMASLIENREVQVESIPLLRESGYTNADSYIAAKYFREVVSSSGQALNFISQVEKVLSPSQLEKIGLVKQPESGWINLVNKVDKGLRISVDTLKTSLVSQFKTASRNARVFGLRFGLQFLDDLASGLTETKLKGRPLQYSLQPAIQDIFAIFRSISPSARRTLADLIDKEPLSKLRLYSTPIHDMVIGDKYRKLITTFTRAQEFFTRALTFDSSLTGDLGRLGAYSLRTQKPISIKTFYDLPENIRNNMLVKATARSLDLTLAKSPTSEIGKSVLHVFNEIPIISPILQATVYPFARFMENSLRTTYEFSPFGASKMLSKQYRDILASGDPRLAYSVINKAVFGSILFSTAVWFRNSKYAGEKWYEYKPNPDKEPNRVFDIRPFNPIYPAYSFLVEALSNPSKMENRDWIEGMLGINRIAGTTLYMTSLLSGMGPDQLKKAVTELSGELIGGFSVPLRSIKDVVAQYSKEERIPRETKISPLTAPFMANIPFLSRKLPPRYALTRPGVREQEEPLREQLSGVRRYTKTEVETEIDNLGLKPREIMPKTGIAEADNEIRRIVGDHIDEIMLGLMQSKNYQSSPKAVKKEMFKARLINLRAKVIELFFKSNKEFAIQRTKKQLPKDILNMIENSDLNQIRNLPRKLQKKVSLVLSETR